MEPVPDHHADLWLARIFAAKAAEGQVIRRNIAWIDREVGRARFMAEVRRRRFHLLQTADQFIVVCHSGPVYMLF
ncbi:N-(5'-phosphoribosyl)anthranilate isomerase [Paragemmobacter ruber]|uniref:N-(5'-phosphoribosyl)anthranilate isomerase n=1 Tax=Paragemmobacter ruber TaxID=1985673 RepID=A0ABW9Y761_9RHOB|nr:N-(5'-phosphoribosyl)anthranilate isomerase [Rhodobacter ruber]NBE08417.1 N-(5'-phosphoribosyl)anthranilate isomerase [Rhodobacter ruber]